MLGLKEQTMNLFITDFGTENAKLQNPFIFTFTRGEHAGERYTGSYYVCSDPTCDCYRIALTLIEEDGSGPGPATGGRKYEFDLDILEHKVSEDDTMSKANTNFARAFVSELNGENWEELAAVFYSLKRFFMDKSDLSSIDFDFSSHDIEERRKLTSYSDVFPFCDRITFPVSGNEYLAIDMYCLYPTCKCKDAHLVVVPVEDAQTSARKELPHISRDFVKRKWSIVERASLTEPELNALCSIIERSVTGLDDLLRDRHGLLRSMYARYRKKNGHIARDSDSGPEQFGNANAMFGLGPDDTYEPDFDPGFDSDYGTYRAGDKPGRNEPCPCGSGKKFKRCCGAS